MLAMEATGSSQWMDLVEPDMEGSAAPLGCGSRDRGQLYQLGEVNPAAPGWVGGLSAGAVGGKPHR